MEKLRIIHTNDLHSHFEQFPKIKRFINQAQHDDSVDQTLTFDAGDFMDRSHPLSEATKGQANIKLMNQFNYDAITIGNNEGISNSHQVLENLFTYANFPVVLANLFEEDETRPTWAQPYKILTTNKGTKIALVGLTAAYPMTYEPNHWHVKPIFQTLDNILPKLEGKYDVLIVISHIGIREDRYIAEHYPEVNLIIGGHSHTLLPKGEKVNQTWITQTGKWGRYVGDIRLELDNHHLINIYPTTHAVKEMKGQASDQIEIDTLFDEGSKLLDKNKIAKLPAKFLNNKEEAIKVSLDAICDRAQADLGIISSGLFLMPFKSGVISEKDLHQSLPHPMHLVRTKLKGKDLWRLVMEIEKNRHYLKEFPLQGMSFRGKVFGEMFYKGIKVDQKNRRVYVHGKEIDPDKEYVLANLDHYVLIPFFPTLSIVGDNKFIFPDYLRTVVGKYLSQKYPLDEKNEK